MKILKLLPFGAVLEKENNLPFFDEEGLPNVVSLMGLIPNTKYEFFTTPTAHYVVNVKDYNNCINTAIYTAEPGSTVYIPKGYYELDVIFLKSDVDIYLEKGASIIQRGGSLPIIKGYQKNYDHTEAVHNSSWEGNPLDCYVSLFYGKNIKNVNIYGEGIIDGNGDKSGFWDNPKEKHGAFRPRNIFLAHSKDICIAGITSRNSASWNIHPYYSDNISLLALNIESPLSSPNTDGINPESSSFVDIIGCRFSVGDDCIAIKSGKYYMSKNHYKPSENIIIRNCLMDHGHGGVVVGSEIACGVYNVNASKCIFGEVDRGFRIKTRRGRGEDSIVDGIYFENIVMHNVKHGFVINMFYNQDPDGKSDYVKSKVPLLKDEFTPTVRNINLKNIRAYIKGTAIFIYGLPENPVDTVTIEDCEFNFTKERVIEEPAFMCDFEVKEALDFFEENTKGVVGWKKY